MMKDCNSMSRSDFLDYQHNSGKKMLQDCCYFVVLTDLMKIMMDIKI